MYHFIELKQLQSLWIICSNKLKTK